MKQLQVLQLQETAGWKSLYILTGILTMFPRLAINKCRDVFSTSHDNPPLFHSWAKRYIVQPQIGYFGYVSVPVLTSNISKLES